MPLIEKWSVHPDGTDAGHRPCNDCTAGRTPALSRKRRSLGSDRSRAGCVLAVPFVVSALASPSQLRLQSRSARDETVVFLVYLRELIEPRQLPAQARVT